MEMIRNTDNRRLKHLSLFIQYKMSAISLFFCCEKFGTIQIRINGLEIFFPDVNNNRKRMTNILARISHVRWQSVFISAPGIVILCKIWIPPINSLISFMKIAVMHDICIGPLGTLDVHACICVSGFEKRTSDDGVPCMLAFISDFSWNMFKCVCAFSLSLSFSSCVFRLWVSV